MTERRSRLRDCPMRLSWDACEVCGCGERPDHAALAQRIRQAPTSAKFTWEQRKALATLNRLKPERYVVEGRLLCLDCYLLEVAIDEGRATRPLHPSLWPKSRQVEPVSDRKYDGGFGSETAGRFQEADDLEKRGVT